MKNEYIIFLLPHLIFLDQNITFEKVPKNGGKKIPKIQFARETFWPEFVAMCGKVGIADTRPFIFYFIYKISTYGIQFLIH